MEGGGGGEGVMDGDGSIEDDTTSRTAHTKPTNTPYDPSPAPLPHRSSSPDSAIHTNRVRTQEEWGAIIERAEWNWMERKAGAGGSDVEGVDGKEQKYAEYEVLGDLRAGAQLGRDGELEEMENGGGRGGWFCA